MDHLNQGRKTKKRKKHWISRLYNKTEERWNVRQIFKTYKRTYWGWVHEGDSYAPHSWSTWNGPIELSKRYWNSGKLKMNQNHPDDMNG